MKLRYESPPRVMVSSRICENKVSFMSDYYNIGTAYRAVTTPNDVGCIPPQRARSRQPGKQQEVAATPVPGGAGRTILCSALPRATTGLSDAMSIAVYMSLSMSLRHRTATLSGGLIETTNSGNILVLDTTLGALLAILRLGHTPPHFH